MAGTKRMSKEEKRKAILDIYHKTQQVYTEKEITQLAAKAGVNAQSIPDIHQELVDDGLIDKAKIGGSNYCWSFKAKKDRMAQKQHETTLQQIELLRPKVEEAKAKLADAKRGREDDDDDDKENNNENGTSSSSSSTRATKLARLATLAQQTASYQEQLAALKENDPAALADLEQELKLVREAAHRWTDNIFECKSYLVKKRGMEKKEANTQKIRNMAGCCLTDSSSFGVAILIFGRSASIYIY
eukprot:scaffold7603_cov71-Cylindrotheca_fusiformis.AAC.1